jgi:hypothetical protein
VTDNAVTGESHRCCGGVMVIRGPEMVATDVGVATVERADVRMGEQ